MRLSEPLKDEIFTLAAQLLDVIDLAGSTERALFEYHGQTEQTFNDLEALRNVSSDAQDNYRRLTGLLPSIARDPVETATAKMNLLEQTVQTIYLRLSAFRQSIREVQQFWSLP